MVTGDYNSNRTGRAVEAGLSLGRPIETGPFLVPQARVWVWSIWVKISRIPLVLRGVQLNALIILWLPAVVFPAKRL